MNIIEIAYAQTIANAPTFAEVGGKIILFLLRVFGFVAIIGLVISGLIYLTAGGDYERIDLAKKSFGYSLVGILLVLGIYVILKQIGGILE